MEGTQLSDLYKQKQKAVESLDFEAAELINSKILNTLRKNAQNQIDQALNQASNDLNNLFNKHRGKLFKNAENKRQQDSYLYSKYQVLYEEIKNEHNIELLDLERDRVNTLLEESEKEVPEQIQYLEQAKKEAALSNFEKAKELKEKSFDVCEEELERRRLKVNQQFSELKKQLLARQQQELDEITEMHEHEFNEFNKDTSSIDLSTSQKYKQQISSIRNIALVKIEEYSVDKTMKNESIRRLEEMINEKIYSSKQTPPPMPKLTSSEKMRLTALSPSKATMNQVKDESIEEILRKTNSSYSLRRNSMHNNYAHASTGLLSRASTANIGHRTHRK
ncbi:hypothetical protein GPJ56_000888 [Histomonas meleagridis]|uniref:uncharacterized protein n=1 Tax=Histomonas meleagridis TaxID=135588 RepID=UPI00355A5EC0|nr:hypothetical protein GPJ56_000888 [Histomonas meleagridis]KAH0801282.1 hypothetical protein GO595_005877 [Histomonas meleagridis]